MNKKRIRWIIALMSVALIGIIALQVYWIKHDIAIKEQQFSQSVSQAMNSIVDKIETREAFSMMKERLIGFDPHSVQNLFVSDTATFPPVTITDTDIVLDRPYSHPPPLMDELDNADINIEFQRPGSNRTILRFQHRNYYKTDSISKHHVRTSEITRIYNDSAEIMIRRNEEKIKARVEKMQEVMQEWARGFADSDDDILKRIDPNTLDTIIKTELANRGLNLSYEYGVLRGNSHKLLFTKTESENAEPLAKSKYKTQLFPNDIFSKPDYLILNFPNSSRFVLASMWLMLASSSVFTLIILFVFTYTIQVIIRQKKLSDIKSDFINNMTHEFKTPIATISLAVDSMKDSRVSSDKEKLNYFAKIIREENRRMNVQVEHVLQMAQIDKGELKLQFTEVNLHDIIVHAVEQIKIQVESREGSIECMLDSTKPVIKGDALHLSNVVFNLLDNANKYSPEKPVIKISTNDSYQGIIIRVKDNGRGMSHEAQKKIFEKFYRVPTGNVHDVKGFGLGLSYVKAIIEQHGGWIHVRSELSKGSTFEIFLPS
jgi:two-component system, OmpR family, phosphate regulon sensor histidine kinase PhoR